MRQHKAQRPYDVRGVAQQDLAFAERLTNQTEFIVLEIAQSAVDQLGARRRGALGKIALLRQEDLQAPTGGIARNTAAVDATADDRNVVQRRMFHYSACLAHVRGAPSLANQFVLSIFDFVFFRKRSFCLASIWESLLSQRK